MRVAYSLVIVIVLAASLADGQTSPPTTVPAGPDGTIASVAPAGGAALGTTYNDALNGFSIRPPLNSEVRREPSVTEMVQFNVRDPKSGAVDISIIVLQAIEHTPFKKLEDLARVLPARLMKDQGYRVDQANARVIGLAGRPAIDLRGQLTSPAVMYCRQVWVHTQTKPDTFLVIACTGPMTQAQQVDQVSQASLETLRLFDPKAAREQRQQDLARGTARLARLTTPELSKVIAPDDYWMAILKDGKSIGFMHFNEQLSRRTSTEGIQVISEIAVLDSQGGQSLSKQVSFASTDRTAETWDTLGSQTDAKGNKAMSREFGLKQAEMVLVQTVVDKSQTRDIRKKLPVEMYLPQAMSPLWPRLVDRSTPGSYAVAVFNPGTRGIEMRTLTVVGPRKISIGGQAMDATLMTDQMAMDAPVAQVYVDGQGLPLLIQSEDGTILQRTTGQHIQSSFPKQWAEVKQLGTNDARVAPAPGAPMTPARPARPSAPGSLVP